MLSTSVTPINLTKNQLSENVILVDINRKAVGVEECFECPVYGASYTLI